MEGCEHARTVPVAGFVRLDRLGQLPGGGATLDAPTAILSGGSLDLFVRGTDNNVYVNRFDGTRYTGWARLPIVATN